MILRKPYAFLIKHFKLLHLIIVIPMIYLLFQTNVLLEFVNEYTASPTMIVGGEFTTTLFSTGMFVLNFFIILIALILIAVMYNKKKPFLYYIFTVFVYFALFVLYIFAYSTVGKMQSMIIDSRITRALGDILLIAYLAQLLNIVQTLIRATGFDIKKFDFGKDLQELNISSEDNEEFEFEMNVNTTKITNNFRKSLRFMRYAYIENKLLVDCFTLAIVCVITYFIFINIAANNRFYAQDAYFNAGTYTVKVDDAYVTDRSYDGEKIDEEYVYVVVRADIKNRFRNDQKLNSGLFQLQVGDNVYFHDSKTRTHFTDLGNVYNNYTVPKEDTEYLFVYQIPISERHEKMYFRYLNNEHAASQLKSRYLKVRLEVEDLMDYKEDVQVKYGENLVFNNSILLNTLINIASIDIDKSFNAKYKFCAEENLCYDSIEIVRPEINTNYDKVLMRIKGKFKLDEGVSNDRIKSIYGFLNKFGTVEYVIDGRLYKDRITSRIATKKFNSSTLFIEVNSAVLNASEIYLKINVRNVSFVYKIK